MATATPNTRTAPHGAERRVGTSARRRLDRRRTVLTPAEHVIDQTQWKVTADGTVTDVASRADVWREATAAYSPGHPVVVTAA
jgi:hypothetical protein